MNLKERLAIPGEIGAHLTMLADPVRLRAFAAAIAEVVRPGDVVVDVGTGTGVLAVLAARAGARRVYAVERGPVAHLAERVVRENGLAQVIEVVRGEAGDATFPEPPDVIIAELIGHAVVDENIADILRRVAPRCVPEVQVIPRRLALWLAPVRCSALTEAYAGMDCIEGVKLQAARVPATQQIAYAHLDPDALLSEPVCAGTLTLARDALPPGFRAEARLVGPAPVDAIALWFGAQLSPSVTLDSGPRAPKTCWNQTLFPLYPPLPAGCADVIDVELACRIDDPRVTWTWTVTAGRERRQASTFGAALGDKRDVLLQHGFGTPSVRGEGRGPHGG